MDSVMYTGTWRRPSWTAMVWPTMSGMMVERRDQVLMTFFSPLEFNTSTFFNRWSSTNGPFFKLRGIPAQPFAYRRAPRVRRRRTIIESDFLWRDRVTSTRGLALSTTERVVDRVHGHSTGLGTLALPAVASCLPDLDQLRF